MMGGFAAVAGRGGFGGGHHRTRQAVRVPRYDVAAERERDAARARREAADTEARIASETRQRIKDEEFERNVHVVTAQDETAFSAVDRRDILTRIVLAIGETVGSAVNDYVALNLEGAVSVTVRTENRSSHGNDMDGTQFYHGLLKYKANDKLIGKLKDGLHTIPETTCIISVGHRDKELFSIRVQVECSRVDDTPDFYRFVTCNLYDTRNFRYYWIVNRLRRMLTITADDTFANLLESFNAGWNSVARECVFGLCDIGFIVCFFDHGARQSAKVDCRDIPKILNLEVIESLAGDWYGRHPQATKNIKCTVRPGEDVFVKMENRAVTREFVTVEDFFSWAVKNHPNHGIVSDLPRGKDSILLLSRLDSVLRLIDTDRARMYLQ